jgi:hypothetical protein
MDLNTKLNLSTDLVDIFTPTVLVAAFLTHLPTHFSLAFLQHLSFQK